MISIVAPAYNEEQNVKKFVEGTFDIVKKCNYDAEVVVVNDGSTDNTSGILHKLKHKYRNLTILDSETNKGYTEAFKAGIHEAKGDLIILTDSDLQYDPRDLPLFVGAMKENNVDCVIGKRTSKADSFLRRLISKSFLAFVNIVFMSNFRDTNCTYRICKSWCIKNIRLQSKGYYLPTEILLKWKILGYTMEFIDVAQHKRLHGKSSFKYFRDIVSGVFFILYLRILSIAFKFRLIKDI